MGGSPTLEERGSEYSRFTKGSNDYELCLGNGLNCVDELVISPAACVEIFNKHQVQGSHGDLLINLNPGLFEIH